MCLSFVLKVLFIFTGESCMFDRADRGQGTPLWSRFSPSAFTKVRDQTQVSRLAWPFPVSSEPSR